MAAKKKISFAQQLEDPKEDDNLGTAVEKMIVENTAANEIQQQAETEQQTAAHTVKKRKGKPAAEKRTRHVGIAMTEAQFKTLESLQKAAHEWSLNNYLVSLIEKESRGNSNGK